MWPLAASAWSASSMPCTSCLLSCLPLPLPQSSPCSHALLKRGLGMVQGGLAFADGMQPSPLPCQCSLQVPAGALCLDNAATRDGQQLDLGFGVQSCASMAFGQSVGSFCNAADISSAICTLQLPLQLALPSSMSVQTGRSFACLLPHWHGQITLSTWQQHFHRTAQLFAPCYCCCLMKALASCPTLTMFASPGIHLQQL